MIPGALQGTESLPDASRPVPAEPIVPPRPNLGPEPWPDPAPGGEWAPVALALLIGLLAAGLGLGFRSRSRRRARRRAGGPGGDRGPSSRQSGSSPEDRRIRRAEVLRDALVNAFGPSWNAKTTEEIGADPALPARLGPEASARAVAILAEADRAKFAGPSAGPPADGGDEDDDDDRGLDGLLSSLAAPPADPGR
ncbi:hypothetical protein AB1L88_17945 [Tautonia sp. JC769]|uniref:hypothetical protein n=1 Tax=Tautonia sp. JC769 TaxID=3232135 RepID=UPI003458A051